MIPLLHMKRIFLSVIAGLLLVPAVSHGAAATPVYHNSGVVSATYPEIGPRIDATTFINSGSFGISNYFDFYIFGTRQNLYWYWEYPYETWNTLNYTNYGIMAGLPGFRFDYKSTAPEGLLWQLPAANFFNGHSVNGTNTLIFGDMELYVKATNIVNTGSLIIGSAGYMRLDGNNVDLSRGFLGVQQESEVQFGSGTNSYATPQPGVQDEYWGTGTNALTATFTPTYVSSSFSPVTMFDGFYYMNTMYAFQITNDITAYVNVAQRGVSNYFVDILVLGHHNPDISAAVRFDQLDGPSTKAVRWESVMNDVNDLPYTNRLYLVTEPVGNPEYLVMRYGSPTTYRPANYRIYGEYPFWDFMTEMPPSVLDPALFIGTNQPQVRYSAYGAEITAEPFRIDPALSGATYSNLAGRIEITAKDVLDLTDTRISGAGYLSVDCPKHFVGNEGAFIDVPFLSMNLASTNNLMKIDGLVAPAVRKIVGDLEVWSGAWTNASAIGILTYNVVIVENRFQAGISSKFTELGLKAAELEISDPLYVQGDLLVDAERVTIHGEGTRTGGIHLLNSDLIWSANFPSLLYLTNWGSITSSNTLFFGKGPVPPWLAEDFSGPYNAFVNHGEINSQGSRTWANYYENDGSVFGNFGPISVRSVSANVSNGFWDAPNADISFESKSLTVSNQVLNAARAIVMDVSDVLDDGSLMAMVENVTNKNVWATGAGVTLKQLPKWSSLLATTITNTAHPYAPVLVQWGATNNGCSVTGFVNNAAVGRMVLDGGQSSVFRFAGTTGNNALYVDRLEFVNFPADIPLYGDGSQGVELMGGFKLYFAQATANGVDISERLNSDVPRQNGFCWVGGYSGYFSSTNMVYDGRTNMVNYATAISQQLDSDGDGVPNYWDPSPVRIQDLWTQQVVSPTNIVVPPGGDDGGGTVTNPPAGDELPTIEYPEPQAPYTGPVTTAGSYYGLFYNEEAVALPSSGFCRITVNSRGTYSGLARVAGRSHAFAGRLVNKTGTNYVRRVGNTPLSISFEVDDNDARIEGAVNGGSWSATWIADKLQANARNKSPFQGRYTMVIPAVGDTGCGYGTVLVTPLGSVVWSGRLGDGVKATQTAAVSSEGVWPFYTYSARSSSMAISWLQFGTNDLGGNLVWIKSGVFTNECVVEGSRYVRPKAGEQAIDLFQSSAGAHGRLVYLGAGVPMVSTNIVIGNANQASFPRGSGLALRLIPGSGLFQGKFTNPATGRPVSFLGALLQEQNYGAGQFMIGSTAGQVYLTPPAP